MTPSRPGGAEAAIDTATGPEKDSPSSTNGRSFGNSRRAIFLVLVE
jgi:hypothetical protein